jgi:FtsP/CotA-like multicopper oxidase with cupredoxin domain
MDATGGYGAPSRRTFLGSLAVLGLGTLVGTRSGEPAPIGRALPTPAMLRSRDGVLAVRLVAGSGGRSAGAVSGSLGYNGASPGPTLSVRPGDELRIHLVNRLDQPTNLHTHGLRVSPTGHSDNPFRRVAPGADFHYRIRIPRDHPPGTHWYHPHHHGHTAEQVGGGLLGALLVRGPDQPDVLDLTERLLVISETDRDATGQAVDAGGMSRMMGRRSGTLRVNGAIAPVLRSQRGRAQRWRVVNGCPSRLLQLGLAGHEVSLIAVDGSDLPAPVQGSVAIPPGGRADLLVVPHAEGRYHWLCAPDVDVRTGPLDGVLGDPPPPLRLATVEVGPPAGAAGAPFTPGTVAVPSRPPAVRRRLQLDMLMDDNGMKFAIDGRSFDHRRVDIRARLGSVEEWTVANPGGMPHPFHLHAHPFTVTATSTGEPPIGVPQDVVMVPGGGWVRFWVAFEHHPGRTVYHCHVLDHEDAGMMGVLSVS